MADDLDSPRIEVPDRIQSETTPGLATSALLVPSPLKCEGVVFAATDVEPFEGPGLEIPLDDLRDRPRAWKRRLDAMKPRSGYRPPLELLIEALGEQAESAR